jgi:hypothetical protein
MKLDFKDQRANVDEFHVATAMAATRRQRRSLKRFEFDMAEESVSAARRAAAPGSGIRDTPAAVPCRLVLPCRSKNEARAKMPIKQDFAVGTAHASDIQFKKQNVPFERPEREAHFSCRIRAFKDLERCSKTKRACCAC